MLRPPARGGRQPPEPNREYKNQQNATPEGRHALGRDHKPAQRQGEAMAVKGAEKRANGETEATSNEQRSAGERQRERNPRREDRGNRKLLGDRATEI